MCIATFNFNNYLTHLYMPCCLNKYLNLNKGNNAGSMNFGTNLIIIPLFIFQQKKTDPISCSSVTPVMDWIEQIELSFFLYILPRNAPPGYVPPRNVPPRRCYGL